MGLIDWGEELPLLPEGFYNVKFVGYRTAKYGGFGDSGKVRFEFEIVEFGPYFGTRLYRWYNANLTGRPKKNGSFKVGRNSDLYRELTRVLNRRLGRRDRLPVSLLRRLVISAKVVTVKNDGRQREIPPVAQYSKIAELLVAVEGGEHDPCPSPSPKPEPTPTRVPKRREKK
ncbi:hypothetical protein [Lentisalinibacter sediminis]|uniref:hypothetical protein n=1 Tax=Lentisalinibacter sediminis TaxID=2992237 RepID=UPI00386B61A3